MSGLSVGPYPIRMGPSWNYASPELGIGVGNSVTIAPSAGPGRRQLLTAMQFCSMGEGSVEIIVKTGSVVLFRLPMFFAGFPTLPQFSNALASGLNESLVLEVGGSDGAAYFNAQGYTE